MASFMHTTQAKSDQLNATDIMGVDLVITIRDAVLTKNDQQPLAVFFNGDNNRPWKPSKGMRRVLMAGWGDDTANLVGKSVKLHFDPSVKYAGQDVGGIRIKSMSDINQNGLVVVEAINKQKRVPVHVEWLDTTLPPYPADRFAKALPVMAEKMKTGEMTLQQVIAKCQQTGQLTAEQLQQLESVTPLIVDDEELEL